MKSQIDSLQKQMYLSGREGNIYVAETTDPIFENISKESIFQHCQRSPLVQPVHNAIIREVTNTPWEIRPLFNYKCTSCWQTYDQKPETGRCLCGGDLKEPDPEQKKAFTNFIDNPNPEVDLYEIIRSYLKWVLSIDDAYISVSYIGRNKSGKMILSKRPLALFVENGLLIRKIEPEDNEYGYFCPICNLEEKQDSFSKEHGICKKHKIPLWETSYALFQGDSVTRRYSKKEIIEGHFNRILPDKYGTPIILSCLNQVKSAHQIDLFNLDTFEKGKLGKIFAFGGTTQTEVEAIGGRIKELEEAARKLKKKITNLFLSSPGDLKVFDVLDDPSKLEALEWHKYYRDLVFSCHGVMPVFAGSVESGKAGNNPGLQIEVQHDTTKAWMKVFTEPLNTVLTRELGITDWYFDFEEVEIADDREDAEIEKIRAETVAIYARLGYEVEFNDDGSLKPPKKIESAPEGEGIAKAQKSQWHDYIPDELLDNIKNALESIARKYEKNVQKIIDSQSQNIDRSKLSRQIESEISGSAKAFDATVKHYLFPIFQDGYMKISREYSRKLKKSDLDPYALAYLEEYFENYETPFMKSWTENERKKIFQIIEEEALKGYNWSRVVKRLSEYFRTRDSYYWRMVARTEGTRAFIESGNAAAKELGYSERRVIFRDDGYGCESCAEASEKGWHSIDENLPEGKIPFHPHCRCYYEYRSDQDIAEGYEGA